MTAHITIHKPKSTGQTPPRPLGLDHHSRPTHIISGHPQHPTGYPGHPTEGIAYAGVPSFIARPRREPAQCEKESLLSIVCQAHPTSPWHTHKTLLRSPQWWWRVPNSGVQESLVNTSGTTKLLLHPSYLGRPATPFTRCFRKQHHATGVQHAPTLTQPQAGPIARLVALSAVCVIAQHMQQAGRHLSSPQLITKTYILHTATQGTHRAPTCK